LQSSNIVILT